MLIVHAAVAFIIALVSGLGVGGGGLFAVYLAIFTELPQLSVQGFNLLFFIFCAASSVTVQLLRRKINFIAVAVMAFFGLTGAAIGALSAAVLPEEYLRRAFGIMLTATGILSLKASAGIKYSKKRSSQKDAKKGKTTSSDIDKNEKDGFNG